MTFKTTLIGIGVAALVLIGVGIWLSFFPPTFIWQWGMPDIAKNLPADFSHGKEEFNARVQNAFPAGMPEDELVKALADEGFVVFQDKRTAGFARSNGRCNLRWWINWEVDPTAKLTSIAGGYGEAGCL